MNHKSRIMGVAGIAVIGVVAACSALLNTPSASHASTEPAWHRLDTKSIFLHDLTSGPATLAAAMTVNTDGSVSGELTTLHELRYVPSPEGIIVARSRDAVQLNESVDGQVFFNPSAEPVMAYFEFEGDLREVMLLPGEGVAIGDLPLLMAAQYKWGCKCVCSGTHPDTQQLIEENAHMLCSDMVPNYQAGDSCDCSGLTDQNCWFLEPVHPDLDGTMRDCKSGLIPVRKGA